MHLLWHVVVMSWRSSSMVYNRGRRLIPAAIHGRVAMAAAGLPRRRLMALQPQPHCFADRYRWLSVQWA